MRIVILPPVKLVICWSRFLVVGFPVEELPAAWVSDVGSR